VNTLKRFLAVVALIISVLVLLVSIGGLAGSWAVGGAVKDGTTKVLSGVERALETTDNGLARVDARLEGARANVNTIEEAAKLLGDKIEGTDFALLLIEKTIGEELFPKIESARETVDTVRASVIGFNNTLEAANEIPFVSVPTLTDDLQAASERTAEAKTAVDDLKTSVAAAKADAVEGAVSAITERTSKIDSTLAELQGVIAEYQAKISTTEDDVASLKSRIRLWIDVATFIIVVGFFWVAVSQIAMLGLGWSYLRNGELVLRKKREPAGESAPEDVTMLEPEISESDELEAGEQGESASDG
jgi:archaellum component FlaC